MRLRLARFARDGRQAELRYFLLIMGASPVAFVVGVVLHNAISAILGVEEPVFFILAVLVAPAAFVVGAIGSAGLLARRPLAGAQR